MNPVSSHFASISLALALASGWAVAGLPVDTLAGSQHEMDRKERTFRGLGRESGPDMQSYDRDRIRSAVLNFARKEMGGKFEALSVDILYPRRAIIVPAGRVRVDIETDGAKARLGRRVFHVTLDIPGHKTKRVRVLADLAALAFAVVPARMIRKDETIEAEAVTVREVRLVAGASSFITDPEQVIGKRARRPLRPQVPITEAWLSEPYLIKRGDRVTIQVRRGGLRVHTVGISRSAGQLGHHLTVMNIDSKREVEGKVVGPGLVEVQF